MAAKEILVPCSYCKENISVVPAEVDRVVKCPFCQQFTKVPARVQKRMEYQCPFCQAVGSPSIKVRGKNYRCWNCQKDTILPAPAELNIQDINAVDHVEQGQQKYEIVVTIANPGTTASIATVQLSFEQQQRDVTSFYTIRPMQDMLPQVAGDVPAQLGYTVDVSSDAPIGITSIHIEIIGQDVLDESPLAAKGTISWNVIPQREFQITTEHNLQETTGIPFALQFSACLGSHEIDSSYDGVHEIHLKSNATKSPSGMSPIIPSSLQVAFHNGIGVTGRDILLYNAWETIKIMAWEEAIGGPEGTSEMINIQPSALAKFEVQLTSPQFDAGVLQGKNEIRAVDMYGNSLPSFAQDLWIYPASNKGTIGGEGLAPNIIPGTAFQRGIADLTALKIIYHAETGDELPKKEVFTVSFEQKEGCSEEIVIEPNPVHVTLAGHEIPDKIEQGGEYSFYLLLKNISKEGIRPTLTQLNVQILYNTQPVTDFYQAQWKAPTEECPPDQEVAVPFYVHLADNAPVGITWLELTATFKDSAKQLYGVSKTSFQWQVEPQGRIFELNPDSKLVATAGKKFSLELWAYLEGEKDTSYNGKHLLYFEFTTTTSPNGIAAENPPQMEVYFEDGVGKTAEEFYFTNASETPGIKVKDLMPGGPQSELLTFTVGPAELDSFWVSIADTLVNGDIFGELCQIMAIDAYGNLKRDFNETCYVYTVQQKGTFYINNSPSNIIFPEAFHEGIADLKELQLAYRCDIQEKLPKEEEFCFECAGKTGKSKPVKILPRPASIIIVRCRKPEEIEPGKEDYPIYLELENGGNGSATISSVLFSFECEGDVSAHYTLLSSPANSNLLIAGVPLQLTYTVKTNPKTPLGRTKVEVKVTGVETETRSPLRAKTSFEWEVKSTKRFFEVTTEHKNCEEAGNPFRLKIECWLENSKENRLNGERVLQFRTNASNSPSGKAASIPDRLTVSFQGGEAWTPSKFTLVNSSEMPKIQVTNAADKIEGQTTTIQVLPGSGVNLQGRLPNRIKDREQWEGINTLTVLDGLGNVKDDFSKDIGLVLEGINAYLTDDKGMRLNNLPGDWFHRGSLDLTAHRVNLVCSPEQKLPARALFTLSYVGKKIFSHEFEVSSSRVIKATLEQIQASSRVIQGQTQTVTLVLNNQSELDLEVGMVEFSFPKGQAAYKYQKDTKNPSRLAPGHSSLVYSVSVPAEAPLGKITAKVIGHLLEPQSKTEILLEGSFTWDIEPTGRNFMVQTENRQKENAGIPFALRLTAMLSGKPDPTYEGVRTLYFKSSATPAPLGQIPRIPTTLKVDFHQGEGSTSRDFMFFNTSNQPQIEIAEELVGGAKGTIDSILLQPGSLQEFQWLLHKSQTNMSPFEGENRLLALDTYGNIKNDFQEDVQVASATQNGDTSISGFSMPNIIPGYSFQNGIVDLSAIKFCYHAKKGEYLPAQERFIASYGNKKGESKDVVIQPRPLGLTSGKITFATVVYQAQAEIPLSVALKNNGDLTLKITEIIFGFDRVEKDISPFFTINQSSKNSMSIPSGEEKNFAFTVDVASQAEIGPVALTLEFNATATLLQREETVTVKATANFDIREKQRKLVITTEHDNVETVGEAFAIKIGVCKDDEPDILYQGRHEICFTIAGKAGDAYSCPNAEVIEFAKGIGFSSKSFILTNSLDRPKITAEERGKAQGISNELIMRPGPLQSLKIIFPEKKETSYTLHPLDSFNNVIERVYKLNEDIKQGMILTGSNGIFYEVLEILGHGAMGKVYKGIRLNDGLPVAIKSMMSSNFSDIGRFLQESSLLIKFDHPNIVKGYDLGQLCTRESDRVQSKFFLVMEYLPGQSTKDLLESSKQRVLNYKLATEIALHAARGLAYIWSQDTLHRDIKPDNIQITNNHKIKLIDLGIARAEGGMLDIDLTQKDAIVGTYPYIAAERLAEKTKGTTVDFRSDMYSLGATYYHMLTSYPPYLETYQGRAGKEMIEYLVTIRTKKMPTPPHKIPDPILCQQIPPAISDVVMNMLQIKPNKRYATANDMLQAIEKLYQDFCK